MQSKTESPAFAEYLMEAGCLGIFMVSACLFAVLMEFPGSPVHAAIPSGFVRAVLSGIAMGVTLLLIIHTPWGKQSGAHMNPAVTLTYWSLGKMEPARAGFYIVGQFAGGIGGVWLALLIAGPPVMHASVNFAVTQPGPSGTGIAFGAEMLISFLMMTVILFSTNSPRLHKWTPYLAATLLALFITFESPLSGMSMNPARTFGSALLAGHWTALWLYFSAPLAGMLLAAGMYRFGPGAKRVYCAKLHHHNGTRCRFRCNYGELHAQSQSV